jgi:hypothetical protein
LRGYRSSEVVLAPIGALKPGTWISDLHKDEHPSARPPCQTSLGFGLDGVSMPHPDLSDSRTAQDGVRKRAACAPPQPNRAMLRRLKAFVRRYVRTHFRPLHRDVDTSVETWLSKTNYPLWRKEELLRKFKLVTNRRDKKYFRVKSFVKDETYSEFKHARGINSRTDEFKCFVGPIFRLIEEQIYQNKHFIKHVPVRERPNVISERLFRVGAVYLATDYTAFESLFTQEIMRTVEFELYRYMTKDLACHKEFMWYCYHVLAGTNYCDYKNFQVTLEATRMSGEMCTSLGNGFSNLMFMLFMLEEKKCTGVDGFVEGDDGLFAFEGPVPSEEDFAQLGLRIKIIEHKDLARASFCGIIFDLSDRINVTNPMEVLCSVGWTSARYARSKSSKLKSLLRCKALSLAHQYPGCPIIQPLAFKLLELTRGAEIKRMIFSSPAFNNWERDQLINAYRDEKSIVELPIGNNTRCLVAEEFGLSLADQDYIEERILKMPYLQVLCDPYLESLCPQQWRSFFDRYSFRAHPHSDLSQDVGQYACV